MLESVEAAPAAFGACVVARTNGASVAYQSADNTDAERGAALLRARAAAVAGDTIRVSPGTYNLAHPLIGKNGVNWQFDHATIQYDGTEKVAFFDDSPTGTNGPIVCTVTGSANFLTTGVQAPQIGSVAGAINAFASFIHMVNAGSSVNVVCTDYRKTNTGNGVFLIHQVAGTMYVQSQTYYDNSSYTGIWWENGQMFIDCVYGYGSLFAYPFPARLAALPGGTETVTGDMHVVGELLDIGFGIANSSPATTYKMWITARSEIVGGTRIVVSGGKNYFGVGKFTADMTLEMSGGIVWYEGYKLSTSDDGSGAGGWIVQSGGVLDITVQVYENGAGADGIAFGSDFLNAGIQVTGGTLNMHGGRMDAILANDAVGGSDMDAIYVGGGTANLYGVKIHSPTGSHDLVVAGGTVNAETLGIDRSKILQTSGTLNLPRSVARVVASDPQHVTPGSRPAGWLNEFVQYGTDIYWCTNAGTPTYKKITST